MGRNYPETGFRIGLWPDQGLRWAGRLRRGFQEAHAARQGACGLETNWTLGREKQVAWEAENQQSRLLEAGREAVQGCVHGPPHQQQAQYTTYCAKAKWLEAGTRGTAVCTGCVLMAQLKWGGRGEVAMKAVGRGLGSILGDFAETSHPLGKVPRAAHQ